MADEHISIMDEVRDFRYRKGMSSEELFDGISKIGYQGLNLGRAAEVIRKMRKERAKIFLTFTSNMASSGLRGLFAQLCEKKLVDVIVTTVGSIEEDFIKAHNEQFYLGDFDADDLELGKKGLNRIGNIYVKSKSYARLEEELKPVLEEIYSKNKTPTPSEICRELGLRIEDKNSFLYQAAKNDIPVYCPAITDGSFGFQLLEMRNKNKDFQVDIIGDMNKIATEAGIEQKIGLIVLGGGVSKHHAILANITNGGADYAVYISTAHQHSGSLSGATTREAKSWGKIKDEGDAVTVTGEVSILFPLLMARVIGGSSR